MTDKLDDKIYQLFDVLEKKKEEVKLADKEAKKSWITNGSLQINNEVPTNIQTADETTLISLVARVLEVQDYRTKAAKELGVEPPTKLNAFKFEEWIADCKTRLAKININQKKTELASLESRLEKIVSPEQRRQMELEALTKELEG